MTIDEVFRIFKFATAKNTGQGNLPSDRFNLVINQAQNQYVSWLLGSFQQYSPGRAIAKVELGMT